MGLREMLPSQQEKSYILHLHRINWRKHYPTLEEEHKVVVYNLLLSCL